MNKQELTQELESAASVLKEHAEAVNKLVADLNIIMRPAADVTFSSIEDAKQALSTFKEAKETMEKVKRALKARATERMKEM